MAEAEQDGGFTKGWDREVKMRGAEAKALMTKINIKWIYPPRPDAPFAVRG